MLEHAAAQPIRGPVSCRIVWLFDVQSVKQTPITKSSAAAACTVVCGASSEQRDAEARRAEQEHLPARPAERGAQQRADERAGAEAVADSRPNPSGPACSVSAASTGRGHGS